MPTITSLRSSLYGGCVLVGIVTSSGLASGAPLSDILEKKLDFPQPVQWKAQGIEISLIGVAWGPANSPEMISKSHEDVHVQKAEFYPDRPYVLGLNFRARVPNVISTSISACDKWVGSSQECRRRHRSADGTDAVRFCAIFRFARRL
jgi:hypothetical protein